MRRLLSLLALASGAFALAPPSVDAACLAPTITVQPTSGAPGAGLAIRGEDFGTDCNDVNPQPGEPPLGEPAQGIRLTLVDAAGAEHALTTVDAADDYTLDVDAAVPDAAAGAGRVEAVVQGAEFGATAPFMVLGQGLADCSGPTVHVQPRSGVPGSPVVVTGEAFGDACNDVNPQPGEPVLGNPLQGIEVTFTDAGGHVTVLGVVDAGHQYRWTLETSVPGDAALGTGSFGADIDIDVFVGSATFEVVGEPTVIPAEPAFTG